jgi:hypothetical protein
MPRLMSVAFTEAAVRERRKTVTRRKGWLMLKPGDRLTLCRKVLGRKKGEPLVRVADVEVVSVRREHLHAMTIDRAYGESEVALEGCAPMSPEDFVYHYFEWRQKIPRNTEVTRIEWRYLDGEVADER